MKIAFLRDNQTLFHFLSHRFTMTVEGGIVSCILPPGDLIGCKTPVWTGDHVEKELKRFFDMIIQDSPSTTPEGVDPEVVRRLDDDVTAVLGDYYSEFLVQRNELSSWVMGKPFMKALAHRCGDAVCVGILFRSSTEEGAPIDRYMTETFLAVNEVAVELWELMQDYNRFIGSSPVDPPKKH